MMTIDDKIKSEKLKHDINKEEAKISALSPGKIDKYEYLTGEEIFLSDQGSIIEQAKFTYSSLSKAFEKQIKTIEDQDEKQIKALEDHRKQLVKYRYCDENDSLTHLKQKEIFEEVTNRRMEEIRDLSKQIDFNNLIDHYKNKTVPKYFLFFKGPLKFYKDIKEGNITLGKAEEEQKEFQNEIAHILKWKYKTGGQIHAINNIKTLYESRKKLSSCLVIILELYLRLNTKKIGRRSQNNNSYKNASKIMNSSCTTKCR